MQLDNSTSSSASKKVTPRPANVADMKDPSCKASVGGFLRGACVDRKKVEALTDINIFCISSMEGGRR